jgi:hypothetical protein
MEKVRLYIYNNYAKLPNFKVVFFYSFKVFFLLQTMEQAAKEMCLYVTH